MISYNDRVFLVIIFAAMVMSWMEMFIKLEWFNHYFPGDKNHKKYVAFTVFYVLLTILVFLFLCYSFAI